MKARAKQQKRMKVRQNLKFQTGISPAGLFVSVGLEN